MHLMHLMPLSCRSAGADMNAQKGRALTQAACFNHADMCELLMQRGASAAAITEALCSACMKVRPAWPLVHTCRSTGQEVMVLGCRCVCRMRVWLAWPNAVCSTSYAVIQCAHVQQTALRCAQHASVARIVA